MKVSNSAIRQVTASFALLAAVPVVSASCPLPSSYQWTSTGPLANPNPGWVALKDFAHVPYNGQHLVYASDVSTGGVYGSMNFNLFQEWYQMQWAWQNGMSSGTVAPTLFLLPDIKRPHQRKWVVRATIALLWKHPQLCSPR